MLYGLWAVGFWILHLFFAAPGATFWENFSRVRLSTHKKTCLSIEVERRLKSRLYTFESMLFHKNVNIIQINIFRSSTIYSGDLNYYKSITVFSLKSVKIILFEAVLWIRILSRIGSVFRSFLDPDPYSEYGSGSTHANIG